MVVWVRYGVNVSSRDGEMKQQLLQVGEDLGVAEVKLHSSCIQTAIESLKGIQAEQNYVTTRRRKRTTVGSSSGMTLGRAWGSQHT